ETLQAMFGEVHAVTDVTGYGLAGHGWEMAPRRGVRPIIETAQLPSYPGGREAAAAGTRTGGDPRNRDYLAGNLDSSAAADREAVCFDPPTSGGLVGGGAPPRREQLGSGRLVASGQGRGRRAPTRAGVANESPGGRGIVARV